MTPLEALEEFVADMLSEREHVWRRPFCHEPRYEGGVCIKCGCYASEAEQPCQVPDADEDTSDGYAGATMLLALRQRLEAEDLLPRNDG